MSDLPWVKLPGHHAQVGGLVAWHRRADGTWEALVEIVEDAPGYRGGLQEPRQAWFRADQVQKIDGENYRTVKRTYE